jgi:hypothetical protein
VSRFQNKEEKFPPPYWFVVAKVWIFGGCWNGDAITYAIRKVSLSWVPFNL